MRYRRYAIGGLLLAVPLAYGTYLLVEERAYRRALASTPVQASLPAAPAQTLALPDPGSLLLALGFKAPAVPGPGSEPARLRGILVATHGQSSAWLDVAAHPRRYTVGERLPSGSVLRRIEADRVLLWRHGREEVLRLAGAAPPLLKPAHAMPHQTGPVHLRPVTVAPGGEP